MNTERKEKEGQEEKRERGKEREGGKKGREGGRGREREGREGREGGPGGRDREAGGIFLFFNGSTKHQKGTLSLVRSKMANSLEAA